MLGRSENPPWCGDVHLVRPFPECTEVVFGRVAARSAVFGPVDAAGGAPVLVGSAAGLDPADVSIRARGELFERVSNVLAGRAAEGRGTTATWTELRRRGIASVDPAAWGMPGDRTATMLWVRGRSLVTGDDVLVPAGAAFLRHRPPAGCAPGPQVGSTGLASQTSTTAAVRHAALEVLERDLIARSWYDGGQGDVVTVDRPPIVDALGLGLVVLALSGPAGTACAVACLTAAGSRCRQSFGARAVAAPAGRPAAFERAVFEALMVRWSMTTAVAEQAWAGMQTDGGFQSGPLGALEHGLWSFHLQDSLSHWLDRLRPASAGPHPTDGHGDVSAVLADHTGDDIVAVETTVPDVRASGSVVVRVVAPGARRLPVDEREPPAGVRPHPFA